MNSTLRNILGIIGGFSILGGGLSIITFTCTDKIHIGDIHIHGPETFISELTPESEKPIEEKKPETNPIKNPTVRTPEVKPETEVKPKPGPIVKETPVNTPGSGTVEKPKKTLENMNTGDLINLGVTYYRKPDIAEAYKYFSKAYSNGNTKEACYYLGLIHGKNTGGSNMYKDYNKAAFYYGKAAENNHAEAAYELGLLHFYGYGVPKDKNGQAKKWLQKAAGLGSKQAGSFFKKNY